MHRTALGLLLGGVVLALSAPAALGAGPATVSVRVAGITQSQAPTTVTTSATPVVEDSHDCSGTSAGGALDDAVGHANWAAHFDSGFGEEVLDSIFGESHAFGSGLFWSVDINGLAAQDGLCNVELQPGDQVLFFASCDPFSPPPPGTPCFGEPLELSAPDGVVVGQPLTVTVTESNTDSNTGVTTISPSVGATVTAGGQTVTTDAGGHATLTAATAGALVVRATKGDRVDDSKTVSAGTAECACPAPPVSGQSGPPDLAPPLTTFSTALGHSSFAEGHGPRTLSGTASDPDGVRRVALRLTRTYRGRCSTFVGSKAKFEPIRCGATHGQWFAVATSGAWSYLLPAALGPGRYVLDVRATDADGNYTIHFADGTNRNVFTVG